MTKLLYQELSYELNGIFFKTHNELGRFRNEKQYADAVEKFLKEKQIKYKREYAIPESFEGERSRRNIVDFLAEDCIIIEIKVKTRLEKQDYYQLLRYLNSLNLELGFLVNFRRQHLRPKRILNSSYLGYPDK